MNGRLAAQLMIDQGGFEPCYLGQVRVLAILLRRLAFPWGVSNAG